MILNQIVESVNCISHTQIYSVIYLKFGDFLKLNENIMLEYIIGNENTNIVEQVDQNTQLLNIKFGNFIVVFILLECCCTQ